MKKFLLIVTIFLAVSCVCFAQMPSAYEAVSKYYRVYSEVSTNHAQETAQKLDAFFELFNSYFHFDTAKLTSKLNVRIFDSTEGYNSYLSAIIGATKESFVYLQYSDLKKSELVGFQQGPAAFNTSLLRHGFVQFLKSYIKNPPLWMQRGFALYFEKCVFDDEHNFAIYRENLSWLPTLKQLIQNSIDFSEEDSRVLIPLQTLLNPDSFTTDSQKDIFYAQSWGLITFLEGSQNKQYNRLLWDAIRLIKADATLEENEQAVKKSMLTWVNEHLLVSDFISYINNMKTFPELVKAGVESYSQGNYDDAEEIFIQAVVLDANHNLPYYYLGLIHYARKDYSLAEYYYQSALMLGSDPALIYFALGLNAFADGRMEEAGSYLKEARTADPDTYLDKTEDLLLRIENMSVSLETNEGE